MINIEVSDFYTFGTNADDGTELTIDGMVLGNDDVLSGPHDSLRTIFLEKGGHNLSLLMFEPEYTMPLIELGESDVDARLPELRAFLGAEDGRLAEAS